MEPGEPETQLVEDFYDDPEKLSQLLRQRGGGDGDKHTQFSISSPAKPLRTGPAPALLHRLAPSPTRRSEPASCQADLTPQHSAPPTTGATADRPTADKMAYNMYAFGDDGNGNVPGDTQPDSQLFRDCAETIRAENAARAASTASRLNQAAEENARAFESAYAFARRASTQDSDLWHDNFDDDEQSQSQPQLDAPRSPTIASPTIASPTIASPTIASPTSIQDDDDDDDDTQTRANAPLTSPLKFATPAMAGRTAAMQAPELSSAMRTATTPGSVLTAAAFFPAGTGSGMANPMSLTQIFNGTQAGSSPMLGASNEDAVFQRPSPNFRHLRLSSPSVVSTKKPAKTRASGARGRISAYDGPYEDEELDSLPPSPAVTASRGHALSGFFQDTHAGAQSSPGIEGSTRNDPVQVPRTSSNPLSTHSGQVDHHSVPRSPSPQSHHESIRKPTSQRPDQLSQPRGGKDSFTIVDSQPGSQRGSTLRSQEVLLPPSTSKSQYSINNTTVRGRVGYASQTAFSNAAPKPTRSSSMELGVVGRDSAYIDSQHRVPSSPPALDNNADADEDDVVYDEHDYEANPVGGDDDEVIRANVEEGDIGSGVYQSEYVGREYADEQVEMGVPVDGDEDEDEDDGVPRNPEQDRVSPTHRDGTTLIRSSCSDDETPTVTDKPFSKPRMQRHATIPESEDTPPFAIAKPTAINAPNTVLSSDGNPQEKQAAFPSKNKGKASSKNLKSSAATSPARQFRSLDDIANQPDTQFTDIGDLDIPPLLTTHTDGLDQDAETLLGPSPARPPVKKRKITYSARKQNTGTHSPVRSDRPILKVSDSSPVRRPNVPSKATATHPTQREQPHVPLSEPTREEADVSAGPLTLRVTTPSKSKSMGPQKKGALKPVNKSILQALPPKVKGTGVSAHIVSPSAPPHAPYADSAMPDADDLNAAVAAEDGGNEPGRPPPRPPRVGPTDLIPNVSTSGADATDDILFPDRLFAAWPGGGYFPATCLRAAGARSVQVCYDEGQMNTLDLHQVRMLDLRKGDQVKVDVKGLKTHTYIVVDFADKITDGSSATTDCHGYGTVVLEIKQRESLPAAQTAKQPLISAPVTNVYLTNQLFSKFHDRLYRISPSTSPAVSTPRKVVTPGAANGVETPSFASTRRGTAGPSLLRESLRAGSIASSVLGGDATTFLNMAFAVTLQDDEEDVEKTSISKLITRNGGRVLDGFYELFEDIDAPDATSRLKSAHNAGRTTGASNSAPSSGLVLNEQSRGLYFAALITDTHSRRTKYIQALALNIPCLHHRWITDSISAGYPLPFGKYVLPAGLSTFLDPHGVIRSRNMSLYDPNSQATNLEDIINNRDLLLRNKSVLLVTGKSKKEAERRKPYLFLTHALGPEQVGRCADLAAAKDMLEDGGWDWVFVDGGAEGLAEAEKALSSCEGKRPGTNKPTTKTKKRKRGNDTGAEPEPLIRVAVIGGKSVRLACDEFVVQSLILGALLEE